MSQAQAPEQLIQQHVTKRGCPMNRSASAILTCLLLTAGVAVAQDAADAPHPPQIPLMTTQPSDTLDTRMAEIRAVFAQERLDVDALADQLGRTDDHAERTLLQQRIAEVKKNAEVEMLRVQLRYARLAEQSETVARLEASIAQILDPAVSREELRQNAGDDTGARR
jgi:crotonobetainyl-CoA:carnitine CoA-transferase CaiB-like acyl-CoA transferase